MNRDGVDIHKHAISSKQAWSVKDFLYSMAYDSPVFVSSRPLMELAI